MAQAANQAQLDLLAEHERIRRSTALPKFFGNQKDTLTARDYLERHEKAARIGKWTTDERKIDEFSQLLRGPALDWWKGLKDFDNLDLTKWEVIQKEFLKDFERKYTAKTICANFKDMQQKPTENVRDYWAKISGTFRKLFEAAPEKMGDLAGHLANDEIENLTQAEKTAAIGMVKYGMTTSKMFIQTQMFIAGLREDLRHRVMEGGKTDPMDVFRYAQEMEQIESEK